MQRFILFNPFGSHNYIVLAIHPGVEHLIRYHSSAMELDAGFDGDHRGLCPDEWDSQTLFLSLGEVLMIDPPIQ